MLILILIYERMWSTRPGPSAVFCLLLPVISAVPFLIDWHNCSWGALWVARLMWNDSIRKLILPWLSWWQSCIWLRLFVFTYLISCIKVTFNVGSVSPSTLHDMSDLFHIAANMKLLHLKQMHQNTHTHTDDRFIGRDEKSSNSALYQPLLPPHFALLSSMCEGNRHQTPFRTVQLLLRVTSNRMIKLTQCEHMFVCARLHARPICQPRWYRSTFWKAGRIFARTIRFAGFDYTAGRGDGDAVGALHELFFFSFGGIETWQGVLPANFVNGSCMMINGVAELVLYHVACSHPSDSGWRDMPVSTWCA